MGRHESVHSNPQGAGDARPTALQIIHDESLEGKLVGKVIVLTGGSAGIGIETARALSVTGATLIITVRDMKKAETALHGILEPSRVSRRSGSHKAVFFDRITHKLRTLFSESSLVGHNSTYSQTNPPQKNDTIEKLTPVIS